MKLSPFALLAAASVLGTSAFAGTYSWSAGTAGDADGTWDGSTFNGLGYDAPGDSLNIDGSAAKTITVTGNPAPAGGLAVTSSGATTISGSVGAVGLTKSGAGTLTLSSANTFTSVSISGGVFKLNADGGLGSGKLTVNAGTGTASLGNSNGSYFLDLRSIAGTTHTVANDIAINNAAAYGIMMNYGSSATSLTLSGNITGVAGSTFYFDTNQGSDARTTFFLAGDNGGFNGNIQVNRGNLSVATASSLGSASTVVTYDANSSAKLIFAGSFSVAQSMVFKTTTTLDTGANNVVSTGAISGSAGIIKAGTGTLRLAGANTYTGTTAVNSGTLLLNGVRTSGSSAVTVNSGAVLGGSGTHIGTVTVNAGGTLSGGTGASVAETLTINTGAITLASGSVVRLALGADGTASKIVANGGITFAGNQTFSFIDLGATTGLYANLITGVASDPGTAGWTIANDGWSGAFSYDSAAHAVSLNLAAVPEPSVYGLLGAGAVAGVAFVRRRRRR